MFKRIGIATVILYLVGHALATMAMESCEGWSCDVVKCPDGYAVLVPGKGYLPCEKFSDYIETKDERILR